jgi:hypothetical protein
MVNGVGVLTVKSISTETVPAPIATIDPVPLLVSRASADVEPVALSCRPPLLADTVRSPLAVDSP